MLSSPIQVVFTSEELEIGQGPVLLLQGPMDAFKAFVAQLNEVKYSATNPLILSKSELFYIINHNMDVFIYFSEEVNVMQTQKSSNQIHLVLPANFKKDFIEKMYYISVGIGWQPLDITDEDQQSICDVLFFSYDKVPYYDIHDLALHDIT